MNDNSFRVIDVDINDILPNRFQPRIQFDEEEILELSDSIKEHGVIQPIVVRTIGDKYEIIAGERRYKASVLAGKESVPVIVKNLNDKDSAEVALIENVQRKNLTPIEEALSYKKILDMGYITQENLADKLGKSQSSVANKIRLLNLSDEVQEALLENKISERHARSLLRLSTSKLQNDMLNRIISERLTVRKTDEEIEKVKNLDSKELIKNELSKLEIEKGEIDMNNNMFGVQNVLQDQQPPSFDIFGPTQPQASAPKVEPTPMPEIPTMNEPTFNFNPAPISAPAQESPKVEPTPMPEIPVMSPIIDNPIIDNSTQMTQQSENLFSFGDNNLNNEQLESQPEFKIPDPIIITDYSKQYDPVMPQMTQQFEPSVDFKEIISIIRECSTKIEKYGFKIDVEEYDLTNLYQVIFKIEK